MMTRQLASTAKVGTTKWLSSSMAKPSPPEGSKPCGALLELRGMGRPSTSGLGTVSQSSLRRSRGDVSTSPIRPNSAPFTTAIPDLPRTDYQGAQKKARRWPGSPCQGGDSLIGRGSPRGGLLLGYRCPGSRQVCGSAPFRREYRPPPGPA